MTARLLPRSRLEVGQIVRQHGPEFLERFGVSLSQEQRQALKALAACRTKALGGYLEACDRCPYRRIVYRSCRNRHCPKCQGAANGRWLEARAQELLPAPYFHLVFTLPEAVLPIALANPRIVYRLLFGACSKTLLQLAADPKHLGAQIGFLAVLHTWGQTLSYHPHLHVVVPAGGITPDRPRWIAFPKGKASKRKPRRKRKLFFLPVKVLSRLFRGKLLAGLKSAFQKGRLCFSGRSAYLADAASFARQLRLARKKEWVVYAKRPFGSPEQVLKYLSGYTHKTAISNRRLLDLKEGIVRLGYKDYASGEKKKVLALSAVEFLRRFLLHVLPKGLVRVRHFGFLANRDRRANLALCRALLAKQECHSAPAGQTASASALAQASTSGSTVATGFGGFVSSLRCPCCGQGTLVFIEEWPAEVYPCGLEWVEKVSQRPAGCDTS